MTKDGKTHFYTVSEKNGPLNMSNCWDIAFYKKMVENCRRQHCQSRAHA